MASRRQARRETPGLSGMRRAGVLAAGENVRRWRYQFIMGIDAVSLFRMLWRNRFRVSGKYLGDLLYLGGVSVFSTVFGACEKLIYGRRIAKTEIVEHPVFILGHWRSGTTFLHKLLSLDARHAYPTLFQCIFPNCFLGFEGPLKHRVAAGPVPVQFVAILAVVGREEQGAL